MCLGGSSKLSGTAALSSGAIGIGSGSTALDFPFGSKVPFGDVSIRRVELRRPKRRMAASAATLLLETSLVASSVASAPSADCSTSLSAGKVAVPPEEELFDRRVLGAPVEEKTCGGLEVKGV